MGKDIGWAMVYSSFSMGGTELDVNQEKLIVHFDHADSTRDLSTLKQPA
jgi:hypothetical protein